MTNLINSISSFDVVSISTLYSQDLCKLIAKKIDEMWGLNIDWILIKIITRLPSSIRTCIGFSVFYARPNPILRHKMKLIGEKIGLNDFEMQYILSAPPIAGQPLPPPTSPFSKFCISTILFLIIAFIVFVAIFWSEVIELPHPLYTPGTRYGAIAPDDFVQ